MSYRGVRKTSGIERSRQADGTSALPQIVRPAQEEQEKNGTNGTAKNG